MSARSVILRPAHERTAVWVPGPSSRQPRDHRTVPQGKSGRGLRASGGRPSVASPEKANDDTAPSERSRCGSARAYHRAFGAHPVRRSTWPAAATKSVTTGPAGAVAVVRGRGPPRAMGGRRCLKGARSVHHLLPGHGRGRSRWSWLACGDCRSVNAAIENVWGFRSFALGRHSLMNGIGVRSSAQPDVRARQIARLAEFGRGDDRLRAWRRREYQRLARSFDPLADIPSDCGSRNGRRAGSRLGTPSPA